MEGLVFLDGMRELWLWAAGSVAGVAGVVGCVVRAGETKQKFAQMRSDLDRHEGLFRTMITEEDHKALQLICQTELRHRIDKRIEERSHMIQAENKEIFDDLYDQISVMNGNLCHLMGAMNVEPIKTPKRRRKTDKSRDFSGGEV